MTTGSRSSPQRRSTKEVTGAPAAPAAQPLESDGHPPPRAGRRRRRRRASRQTSNALARAHERSYAAAADLGNAAGQRFRASTRLGFRAEKRSKVPSPHAGMASDSCSRTRVSTYDNKDVAMRTRTRILISAGSLS